MAYSGWGKVSFVRLSGLIVWERHANAHTKRKLMVNWLKIGLSYLKLKPRYLIGLAIVCFVVILLPKSCREYLAYDELIRSHKGWISLVGICAGIYGFIMLMPDGLNWVQGKLIYWRLSRNPQKILCKLAQDEKECLAKYIRSNVSSLDFHIGGGVINGLEEKMVVYRAADISTHGSYFAFNLQPWVLNALEKYPELKDDIQKHYVQIL